MKRLAHRALAWIDIRYALFKHYSVCDRKRRPSHTRCNIQLKKYNCRNDTLVEDQVLEFVVLSSMGSNPSAFVCARRTNHGQRERSRDVQLSTESTTNAFEQGVPSGHENLTSPEVANEGGVTREKSDLRIEVDEHSSPELTEPCDGGKYCPICFYSFKKIYVSACCRHNICHKCVSLYIEKYSETKMESDKMSYRISCPHCRSYPLSLRLPFCEEKCRKYTTSPRTSVRMSWLKWVGKYESKLEDTICDQPQVLKQRRSVSHARLKVPHSSWLNGLKQLPLHSPSAGLLSTSG